MLHYPSRQIATNPATYDGLGVENRSNFDFEKCTEALESGVEQRAEIVIYLQSGNTVTLGAADIWENGLTVDKNFSTNNQEFPIGKSVSTKVEFDIINKTYIDNQNNEVSPYNFKNCKARVTIYVRCLDENEEEETFDRDVYQGYFILQEIDFTETHFTITGNDYMAFLGFSYNNLMAKGVVDPGDSSKWIVQIHWTNESDTQNPFSPTAFLGELYARFALYYTGNRNNGNSVFPSKSWLEQNMSNIFHAQGTKGSNDYYPVYPSTENSTMTMAEMIGEFVGLYGYNLYVDDLNRLMVTLYHTNTNNTYELRASRSFSHKYFSNTLKDFYFRSSVFLRTEDFEKYQYVYLRDNKFMKNQGSAYAYGAYPHDGIESTSEPHAYNKRFYYTWYLDGTRRLWKCNSHNIFAFEAEVLPAPYLSPDDIISLSMPDLEIPGHVGRINTYLTSVTYTLNGRTRIACDVRYEDNKYLYQ